MPAISLPEVRRSRPCPRDGRSGTVTSVNTNTAVAGIGAYLEIGADGEIQTRPRSLTLKISRWLFVVVGLGLSATVVCIVMYRTGSRTDVPWYYLAILFGNPSAFLAYIACFVRAVDEVQ